MAKLKTDFTIDTRGIDRSLNTLIKLQALVTTREGYIAENQKCLNLGIPPSYGQVFFDSLANNMNALHINSEMRGI